MGRDRIVWQGSHPGKSVARHPATLFLGVVAAAVFVLADTSVAQSPQRPDPSAPATATSVPSDQAAKRYHLDDTVQPESPVSSESGDVEDILNLIDQPLEDLVRRPVVVPAMDVTVTTVARSNSTVGHSPAAVFVLTGEMIRRSGARTLPDALRLVPGVQVSRIDANKWAVSIRGFNGRFANKLLVQLDGRSLYTRLFAGVYWELQDLVLDDIERIEVIRGPGATVWGSNAVNGIINIITKHTADTLGVYVQGGAGTEERGFASGRIGGQLGTNTTYRVFGKWFDRDDGLLEGGTPYDAWHQARGGFRFDYEPNQVDRVMVQGNYYQGSAGHRDLIPGQTPPAFTSLTRSQSLVNGGHALVRWSRTYDATDNWSLQVYLDHTDRGQTVTGFGDLRQTFDVDFQRKKRLGDRHSLIGGLGYRNTRDRITNVPLYLSFQPTQRAADLFSYFLQDEITLVENRWFATVGSKFEHNDYTVFEYQPTGRLLWTPSSRTSAWVAVSRAVRIPSRAEDDVQITGLPVRVIAPPPVAIPVFSQLNGSRDVNAEDLMAYEFGIRSQPTDAFYWDLALYYHDYEDIVGVVPGSPVAGTTPSGWPAIFAPATAQNVNSAEAYGMELAGSLELTPDWNLRAGYTLMKMQLHAPPGVVSLQHAGNNPKNMAYAVLSGSPTERFDVDLIGRYSDHLPTAGVPSYFAVDIRLAWHPSDQLELFAVGRNLLDDSHPEFGADALTGGTTTEVQRGFYGGMTWRY